MQRKIGAALLGIALTLFLAWTLAAFLFQFERFALIACIGAVALTGMLGSDVRENILGIAEVRDVFRSPKFGAVAGCMVVEGVVYRNRPIRVLRDDVVIFEGELESLRRFKDDATEVREGYECGINLGFKDLAEGDVIEAYEMVLVNE